MTLYPLRILSLVLALLAVAGCRTVPWKAGTPPPPVATLTFVGDVLLDHWPIYDIYARIREKGGWDAVYEYPFKKVKPCFEGTVFCNLEGPLTDRGLKSFADKDEISYFYIDSRFTESLKRGKFNVVSLANNHIKDCGERGVLDSIRYLAGAGIVPVGAGANAREARLPAVVEQNGLKIAYLSYDLVKPKSVWAGENTPGAAHASAKEVAEDVAAARKTADVVVVNFHWGIEYRYDWVAAPPDRERVKIAHAAVDAGAQIVVGEHSHTVERIETYKNALIAYGLGNFMFAALTHEGHPESMILKVQVGSDGVVSHEVVPVLISPRQTRYQPVPLEGKAKKIFIRKLEKISRIKSPGNLGRKQNTPPPPTVTPPTPSRPANTPTMTVKNTLTFTSTITETGTSTFTITNTPTNSPIDTFSPTPTNTPTITNTLRVSVPPTATHTPTVSHTQTSTPAFTITPTPTPAHGVVVTTLAGQSTSGSANGTGITASFFYPYGVAVDSSGNVYVADTDNNLIRKITSSGLVTTYAGQLTSGSANGARTAASFGLPHGIAVDSSGNVYVADTFNFLIRKITNEGVVTTLAGSGSYGSANGTGPAASFGSPYGVAVDSSGNVYVADSRNDLIRKITNEGVVTTLAGSAGVTGSFNRTGTAASFNNPTGVAVDSSGNVYVADSKNDLIRKINAEGVVTTLAGQAGVTGATDGAGTAASFNNPTGIAVDSSENIYVADSGNDLIRKINDEGVVTTLAGQAGITGATNGSGTLASFYWPFGIAVDSSGNVYVADSTNFLIRKIKQISINPSRRKR